MQSDDFYPVLGNLIGKASLDKIPVIDGMTVKPDEDQLKAFGAAAASSGGVAMFHMVGITPEAPTLEQAFHGKTPIETTDVTMDTMRESRRELTHTDSNQLHMVVLGSPHFSLAEYQTPRAIAKGAAGKKETSGGEVPRHIQPRHDPACAPGRLPGTAGVVRRADHGGYLYSDLPHAAHRNPELDDQLGKVRVLCAGTVGQEDRVWQSGGLCQFCCGGRDRSR